MVLPCCVLLNLWISSINRIVERLNKARSFFALETSSLTWTIPAVQADKRTKRHWPAWAFEAWADKILARLVFPHPGGPYWQKWNYKIIQHLLVWKWWNGMLTINSCNFNKLSYLATCKGCQVNSKLTYPKYHAWDCRGSR